VLVETRKRVDNGAASLLVAHLLDQSHPSGDELDEIRLLLDEYQSRHKGASVKGGPQCKPSRSKRSKV
jgi:BlaI family transcriptional regulator, penicillinase repressor